MSPHVTRPRLGLLVCGHTSAQLLEQHGPYSQQFIALLGADSFDYRTYNVVDSEFPEHVSNADGWLISGSKHGVYEEHSWIPHLEDFIREAYAAAVPIVGICFGHQILAQALGGRVEKFDGGWNVGRIRYQMESESGSQTIHLNAWHQDQVVELPADATVIGSADHCQYAALAYGNKALGLQPHPEFADSYIQGLLDLRKEVPLAQREAAQEMLDKPLDRELVGKQLRNFLNQR